MGNDRDVRLVALNSLPELTQQGNARALTAVTLCLDDPNVSVRQAAVQALAKISQDDPNVSVRQAAVQALAKTSQDDPNVSVRQAAEQVLAKISQEREKEKERKTV